MENQVVESQASAGHDAPDLSDEQIIRFWQKNLTLR
jgi:hypothetical protein